MCTELHCPIATKNIRRPSTFPIDRWALLLSHLPILLSGGGQFEVEAGSPFTFALPLFFSSFRPSTLHLKSTCRKGSCIKKKKKKKKKKVKGSARAFFFTKRWKTQGGTGVAQRSTETRIHQNSKQKIMLAASLPRTLGRQDQTSHERNKL